MPVRSALPACLLALLLVLLPACSTLGRTTDDDEPERRPPPEEPRRTPPPEEPEERGPRTVQGFRIQVLKTDDKDAADQRAADAEAAWNESVEVAWRAPYYSVRVGAFASRSSAQRTLSAVQQQYPDAFLVPDTVTIYPE
jgi:hypothetical protein